MHASVEAIWIQHLQGKIGFPIKTLVVVYCGNQSAIQVVENPAAHSKMKHVELHAHYSRQLVQDNVVNLVYCGTNDKVANIFTKPLSKVRL